jgi:hypothetical protein
MALLLSELKHRSRRKKVHRAPIRLALPELIQIGDILRGFVLGKIALVLDQALASAMPLPSALVLLKLVQKFFKLFHGFLRL